MREISFWWCYWVTSVVQKTLSAFFLYWAQSKNQPLVGMNNDVHNLFNLPGFDPPIYLRDRNELGFGQHLNVKIKPPIANSNIEFALKQTVNSLATIDCQALKYI